MIKIFYMLIISLIIVSGCGNKKTVVEDVNDVNTVIKDIEVMAPEALDVSNSQLLSNGNDKYIRIEIDEKGHDKFNRINIKIYNEKDELIKESVLQINENDYKGQKFIYEEAYNYIDEEPYKIVIDTSYIDISNN